MPAHGKALTSSAQEGERMTIEEILFSISKQQPNGARTHQRWFHHLTDQQKIDAIVEYLGDIEIRLSN